LVAPIKALLMWSDRLVWCFPSVNFFDDGVAPSLTGKDVRKSAISVLRSDLA
jgi:hypothetical protein